MAQAPALDGLAGDPLDVDLTAAGPWLVQQKSPPAAKTATPETQAAEPAAKAAVPAAKTAPAAKVENAPASIPVEDSHTGTVSLRNANWRADFLAGHVEIAQATLNLSPGEIRWDPVDFSYGPLKGTATLGLRTECAPGEPAARISPWPWAHWMQPICKLRFSARMRRDVALVAN